jgi:prepilin-type N-terminal cleavage/methylation domain-containing protein
MEPRRQSGFSMIEIALVITIVLIVAAFAIPQVLNAINKMKLRGAASDLSALVQQARIMAERQNTTLAVYAGTVETNVTGAFVNCSISPFSSCPIGGNGSTWASTDPDVPYPSGISNGVAANVPTALNPGFTAEPAGTILYFSPRGLPVMTSGATYVASNGVIFYLTDSKGDWVAVSVSGAGRSRVWVLSGTTWN